MLVKFILKLLTSQAKVRNVRYIAAPTAEGNYSAVVLIHSLNCLEPGYLDMVDSMVADKVCCVRSTVADLFLLSFLFRDESFC